MHEGRTITKLIFIAMHANLRPCFMRKEINENFNNKTVLLLMQCIWNIISFRSYKLENISS